MNDNSPRDGELDLTAYRVAAKAVAYRMFGRSFRLATIRGTYGSGEVSGNPGRISSFERGILLAAGLAAERHLDPGLYGPIEDVLAETAEFIAAEGPDEGLTRLGDLADLILSFPEPAQYLEVWSARRRGLSAAEVSAIIEGVTRPDTQEA